MDIGEDAPQGHPALVILVNKHFISFHFQIHVCKRVLDTYHSRSKVWEIWEYAVNASGVMLVILSHAHLLLLPEIVQFRFRSRPLVARWWRIVVVHRCATLTLNVMTTNLGASFYPVNLLNLLVISALLKNYNPIILQEQISIAYSLRNIKCLIRKRPWYSFLLSLWSYSLHL